MQALPGIAIEDDQVLGDSADGRNQGKKKKEERQRKTGEGQRQAAQEDRRSVDGVPDERFFDSECAAVGVDHLQQEKSLPERCAVADGTLRNSKLKQCDEEAHQLCGWAQGHKCVKEGPRNEMADDAEDDEINDGGKKPTPQHADATRRLWDGTFGLWSECGDQRFCAHAVDSVSRRATSMLTVAYARVLTADSGCADSIRFEVSVRGGMAGLPQGNRIWN